MSNIPPAAVSGPLLSPSYQLKQGKLGSEMHIGNWVIQSVKTAILNGKEIEAAEKELSLPLPEMTFGNNSLDMVYGGRVMPHSLFLLSRLFVRVDNVLFRIFDVRMYHAFESDEVVRECTGLEGEYDEVKKYLEKQSELAPLTDPNWVYGVLQKIAAKRDDNQVDQAIQTQPTTQGTQAPWTQTTAAPWASSAAPRETSAPIASRPSLSNSPSSSKKPWPGLGRRVHVLRLPGGTALASAQAGLRDLNLEP
ncbi:hypothetical protein CspHIS471_0105820 [Cutaneotrichosporon sp. HIS471]|nr:hypothetical protein CspHIS471_0105820 [Cutaneotrichosporon sp. HIS471]